MDKSHGLFDGFGEYRFQFSQFLMKNKARQCHISSGENRNMKYQSTRRSPFGKLFQWECLLAFLGILPFMLISPVSCRGWDGVIITQADYQGLQAFKHELDDPRGLLSSWNGTGLDACSGAWVGIKCVRGKVIAIQLPWRALGGHISEKTGQLTALRKLSLHDNSIGGQIPLALGFLRDLRGVYLFNNRFSGTIPPSIGNCLVLQTLDLSNNSLTGSIPSSISNSTRLYRLNLSYNNLSGAIPLGFTRLPTLTFLLLQHNYLSGSIPDAWGGMEDNKVYQLQTLNLEYNFFSGSIPISLGKLPMLEQVTLSNNKLNGSIPEEMGTLPKLQTLDLSHNSIRGSFPPSLCNLSSLVHLNLESNHLENRIPETIDRLKNLSVLSLKRNQFDGEIPATLGNISGLSQLDLSENNLTGPIPASLDLLANLTAFNVSNNNLSGPVPVLLSEKFNSSSFRGNIQLCGYSILVPCPSPPHPNVPSPTISTVSHHRKLSTKDIILIAAGIVLLFLFLLSCALLCCLVGRRAATASDKSTAGGAAAGRGEKPGTATGAEPEAGGDAGGKLVHFDGPLAFTADDLLCATAEIMGKSTYGTVYKATLEDGSHVAVKRLREKMVKNQRDFEAEVGVLGKIRHPNLLALRAYYQGPKGEKLLVFDYMPMGSLAAFLHARGPDTRIDWPTRINIAMAVARGLCHLHVDMKMIHGNITSTNILLDENTNAKIADFGLSRLMTAAASSSVIATAGALGYRAPELSKLKKANTKTDVYSVGVVMLELLTGKSPGETTNGMDLPQWVASIVKEEWTNEVFDLELMRDAEAGTTTGDELLNMLKLALHCVDPSPAARPEAQQILQQLEQIKPELAASAGSSMEEGGRPAAVEAAETTAAETGD